jgi:UDP-N-acetylmuramyl pentapeptide phosphotransferase/UDP-N-acetylglucosamine-1-phosphate transferase
VPRHGGLGVVVAFLVGMLVLYQTADFARIAEPQFLGVILAALAIAGVALVDDIRALPIGPRLLTQAAVAVAAAVALGSGLIVTRLSLPCDELGHVLEDDDAGPAPGDPGNAYVGQQPDGLPLRSSSARPQEVPAIR